MTSFYGNIGIGSPSIPSEGSESGSSSGEVMMVNATYDESAEVNILDKTWQEIHDAIQNGTMCFIVDSFEGAVGMNPVVYVIPPTTPTDTSYVIVASSYNRMTRAIEPIEFYASTANNYPTN